MMDEDMDYEDEAFHVTENRVTISNVRSLNQDSIDNPALRSLQFLQRLSFKEEAKSEDESKKARRQKVRGFLQDSQERLNLLSNLLRIVTVNSNAFKFKIINSDFTTQKEKAELQSVNYLKKNEAMRSSVGLLSKKLKHMSAKNKILQNIFKELIALKQLGFSVEKNFKFPEVKDVIRIKLSHSILKNFENSKLYENEEKFNKKFNFELVYTNKTGKFELVSDLYEQLNNVCFEIIIKVDGKFNVIKSDAMNCLIEDILDATEYSAQNRERMEKYKVQQHMKAYTKYFLYLMFKQEIKGILDMNKKNHFTYKNLQVIVRENGKQYSLSLSNYDFFEITFIARKERRNFMQDGGESLPHSAQEITHCLDLPMLIMPQRSLNFAASYDNFDQWHFLNNYSYLVKSLLSNLLHDLKMYKVIKELGTKAKFAYLLDNSIFVKNISKVADAMIRKSVVMAVAAKTKSFYSIVSKVINLPTQTFTFRYFLINTTQISLNHAKIDFSIVFHKHKISLETKTPLKNNIFMCEREVINEKTYSDLNIKYLLLMIDNLIKNN